MVVFAMVLGLIAYGCDVVINGGVWAGERQLNSFGVPSFHTRYLGESNNKGSDLCYSSSCVTVDRTYEVSDHPRLSQVSMSVTDRLGALGYKAGPLGCAVQGIEDSNPPHWEFSCSIDGKRGTLTITAIMTLAGVNAAQFTLPPLQYSPYGGGPGHDIPTPWGDPTVITLDLDASG
jgi:hypothetical protein